MLDPQVVMNLLPEIGVCVDLTMLGRCVAKRFMGGADRLSSLLFGERAFVLRLTNFINAFLFRG
jgi:hypothetical protein